MLGSSFAIAALALAFEDRVGYPHRVFALIGHPVTWIGRAIDALDRFLNCADATPEARRRAGVLAVALVVGVPAAVATLVQLVAFAVLPFLAAVAAVSVLAATLPAQRSLMTHVREVAEALEGPGLAAGRAAVGRIVGRDTEALDVAGVARAAIESLAENFSDGVVAPAFWLALGGLPGGVAYKAINTADSMIGHRTPRHERFGFAAAKLDDGVNWLPARLSAAAFVVAAALVPKASARDALRVMRRDARGHASPNAGWPEAAMAGALGLRLGGPRHYGGRLVEDHAMGDGAADLDAGAIRRALRLYGAACGLTRAAAALGAVLVIALWR